MTYVPLTGHLRTSIGRFVSWTCDGILKVYLNEHLFTVLVVPWVDLCKGLEMQFVAKRLPETLFELCKSSTESTALRHLFFAERQASKMHTLDNHDKTKSIESVGIVDGRTMGCGITMCFASSGILVEVEESALQVSLTTIKQHYETSVQKRKLSDALRRIHRLGYPQH